MDSVVTSIWESWRYSIGLSTVWAFKKEPAGTPLHQWWGTTEFLVSLDAEEGEQLLLSRNTCSYLKVEEGWQRRWRLHWKITVPSGVLWWSSIKFSHATWEELGLKMWVITFWLLLVTVLYYLLKYIVVSVLVTNEQQIELRIPHYATLTT
jgi:hypothetical protein